MHCVVAQLSFSILMLLITFGGCFTVMYFSGFFAQVGDVSGRWLWTALLAHTHKRKDPTYAITTADTNKQLLMLEKNMRI